jgi:hypothetical protein
VGSGSRFEDQVEGGAGHLAEAGEARLGDDLLDAGGTGLGAEREPGVENP